MDLKFKLVVIFILNITIAQAATVLESAEGLKTALDVSKVTFYEKEKKLFFFFNLFIRYKGPTDWFGLFIQ